MTNVTIDTVLNALTKDRLYDLGRFFGIGLSTNRDSKKDLLIHILGNVIGGKQIAEILRELGRDELRAVCRAHRLDDASPSRSVLIKQLAEHGGFDDATSVAPPADAHDGVPQPGQILSTRGRQWLVEQVVDNGVQESPILRLACLDDDAPGRELEILWDLELGAKVVSPESHGLGNVKKLDEPAHFGAYLHAIKWSAVSAADATRFQSPFRAGIKLMAHQLTPLMKALELPRANLFIADDVGLGKTIEAGLVLQELILRQQAEFVLVVCPASVNLQWRDEMMRRFGLQFNVMSRQFVANKRRERGFGINPWATHNRFIVSLSLIRRPEYRDSLLAHLGARAEKGLLIVDEAHAAAPASASKYAVDSDTTRTIRDLAPKFDNRLFLSATPHNGHSNSFSALLEILDPIRFNRGVPIKGVEELKPVMVRRLKRDLRQLGVDRFPQRLLSQFSLTHDGSAWHAEIEEFDAEDNRIVSKRTLSSDMSGEPMELRLSELLTRYTELSAPPAGQGRFVFINLQKRLLSSPEAFARTVEAHAQSVFRSGGVKIRQRFDADTLILDYETYGTNDDVSEVESEAEISKQSTSLPSLTQEAENLLKEMRALAENARRVPDAKTKALMVWMRENMCPAIGSDASCASKTTTQWADRRIVVFTEYGDTKRYLLEILQEAIVHTDRGDERIMVFHGGMGDQQREEVQKAFNAPFNKHPVRILIATDAAREGINLQAHCADLFHFDVPWNPSRMEQRNGRIDRTLQPESEVRCHYFLFPQRTEDRVLETLVKKINVVQQELGSAGAVLLNEIEKVLEPGITNTTQEKISDIGADGRTETSSTELEAQRKDLEQLREEIRRAGNRLDASKKALEVSPESLRGVIDIGLRFNGCEGLTPGTVTESGRQTYLLPDLDSSWQRTLDSLRPARGRDEPFWEWRKTPPKPVTFEPLTTMTEEAEQLHLSHPLVKRILDRFMAQGFGSHDLSRVCGVVVEGESVPRVVAYARLSLFGPGAARLHDELVAVSASWPKSGTVASPYKDAVTASKARETAERALATGGKLVPTRVSREISAAAPDIYTALWDSLHAEADAKEADARTGLNRRARKESQEMRELLLRQQKALGAARSELAQTTLLNIGAKEQKRQVELDIRHMDTRAEQIVHELEVQPKAIEALYNVRMSRLTPIGMVVAWPEVMV